MSDDASKMPPGRLDTVEKRLDTVEGRSSTLEARVSQLDAGFRQIIYVVGDIQSNQKRAKLDFDSRMGALELKIDQMLALLQPKATM